MLGFMARNEWDSQLANRMSRTAFKELENTLNNIAAWTSDEDIGNAAYQLRVLLHQYCNIVHHDGGARGMDHPSPGDGYRR